MDDGVKSLSGKETKSYLVSKNILPTNYRGYFEAGGQRAILRIGMLLRDNEVAKDIKTS